MFWRRNKNPENLDPNKVPAILVPWLSVIEKYAPDDIEGPTSDRIFRWLKSDRDERSKLEALMSKWGEAEDQAYRQWSSDDSESREQWRFLCFFHILATFEIRPGAYQEDPVERDIRLFRDAKGDSDASARARSAAIAGLRSYGEFARPALPLVKALLNDKSDRVRASAHAFLAELEGNRAYHEAAIVEIIENQSPIDPNLSQIERMKAELHRGNIPVTLESLRKPEHERNADDFRIVLRKGYMPRVRQLLPLVNPQQFEGELSDLLLSVALNGHVECARILLEWGVPADYLIERGVNSPLIHWVAAKARREAMLKLLIEYGADPDRLDAEGRTAAGVAMEFGHREYLPILNRKGDAAF